MRLNEAVAGNRFLRGVIVPGGVRQNITKELIQEIRQVMDSTADGVEDLASMFREQENFQNRIRTTGIVRTHTAKDLAMVGVGARASGYEHDSRQDFDFGVYSELGFKPYTMTMGDVAARLLVRIGELSISFEMIDNLLDMLENEEDSELMTEVPVATGDAWGIC